MAHDLTGELVLRQAWDATSGALKTVPGSATQFQIELDAADGDTVGVEGEQKNAAVVHMTSTSTGVVVAAQSAIGMRSFQVYVKTTATITDAKALTLELSPADTGDVWIATASTLTPSVTAGDVVATTIHTGLARRVRVSMAAAITSGTADIYLLAQGN